MLRLLQLLQGRSLQEVPRRVRYGKWRGNYLKVEDEFVNGNCVLPRIVLLDSGQESLSEEEAWQPVLLGLAVLNPVTEVDNSGHQILDVGTQRFEGRVGKVHPSLGNFVDEDIVEGQLQLHREYNFSLETLFDVFERPGNDFDEFIKPGHLLDENCVH